jgi:hypothetical protein
MLRAGVPTTTTTTELKPLPDQKPAALVLVQVKLLDGCSLGSLAIGRFDRAEIFPLAAGDGDGPASELGGGRPLPCDLPGGTAAR